MIIAKWDVYIKQKNKNNNKLKKYPVLWSTPLNTSNDAGTG